METFDAPQPDWVRVVVKNVGQNGSIWVVHYPEANMAFDRQELHSSTYSNRARVRGVLKCASVSPNNLKPKLGENYAVHNKLSDRWYRGKVICLSIDKIQVFLLDIGDCVWTSREDLLPLNDELKNIAPQAFQINFYGIHPLKFKVECTDGLLLQKTQSPKWLTSNVNYFKKTFADCEEVYLKKKKVINGIYFGYIYLKWTDTITCLNDMLCDTGMAEKASDFNSVCIILSKELSFEKFKMISAPCDENNINKNFILQTDGNSLSINKKRVTDNEKNIKTKNITSDNKRLKQLPISERIDNSRINKVNEESITSCVSQPGSIMEKVMKLELTASTQSTVPPEGARVISPHRNLLDALAKLHQKQESEIHKNGSLVLKNVAIDKLETSKESLFSQKGSTLPNRTINHPTVTPPVPIELTVSDGMDSDQNTSTCSKDSSVEINESIDSCKSHWESLVNSKLPDSFDSIDSAQNTYSKFNSAQNNELINSRNLFWESLVNRNLPDSSSGIFDSAPNITCSKISSAEKNEPINSHKTLSESLVIGHVKREICEPKLLIAENCGTSCSPKVLSETEKPCSKLSKNNKITASLSSNKDLMNISNEKSLGAEICSSFQKKVRGAINFDQRLANLDSFIMQQQTLEQQSAGIENFSPPKAKAPSFVNDKVSINEGSASKDTEKLEVISRDKKLLLPDRIDSCLLKNNTKRTKSSPHVYSPYDIVSKYKSTSPVNKTEQTKTTKTKDESTGEDIESSGSELCCKTKKKEICSPEDTDSSLSDRHQGTRIERRVINDSSVCARKRTLGASDSELSTTETESETMDLLKQRTKYVSPFLEDATLLHQSPSIKDCIRPASALVETVVNESIQRLLVERRRRDLTPLQSYAYPILSKRYNLAVLGSQRSGKTLASVISVLSLLREENFYSSLKPGYGPRAIFLTAYYEDVTTIESMCTTLVNGRDIVVRSAYGATAVEKEKIKLLEGCDILVTTPRCLIRLLKANHVTNIARLCHLVFDDADVLFKLFLPEIQNLAASMIKLEEARPQYKVQKIVLGLTWFPLLENFIKDIMKDGFICIPNNNLLEAAFCSRITPSVMFLQPESKSKVLIDLLKAEHQIKKTVVICKTKEEVLELHPHLDAVCDRLLFAHEGMDHILVSNMKRAWREPVAGLNAVMICTDVVFSELGIVDAEWLVHYSLSVSKTVFSIRFGCLANSFTNFFLDEEIPPVKVYIFVDEGNDAQCPEIVNLMKRFKLPVHLQLENVVKRINARKESQKDMMPVCDDLKQFGVCWRIRKCNFRHIFIRSVDEVESIPKLGYVKIKVLYVHSANHFSALLLEHKLENEWEKVRTLGLSEVIALKMYSHYCRISERALHPMAKLGELVAVQTEPDLFVRAQIIDVTKLDEERKPHTVSVKLLENGKKMSFMVLELYHLPEELRRYPPQAIDIFLCKIQPADLDRSWDDVATKQVFNWLNDENLGQSNNSHYLYGQIALSVGRSLWLEPLRHTQWLEETKTEVYHRSFRYELIREKLAVDKLDHMEILRDLCIAAQMKVPKETSVKEQTRSVIKEQWAHLPRDEFTGVNLLLAENPDMIFIRILKFKDRLEILAKDIVNAKKRTEMKEGDLVVGDLCLAVYSGDQTWNRAKVVSIISAEELEVFFVDHGDFDIVGWNKIATIPDELISQLPFQAIECRLTGIKPLDDQEWSGDTIPALYELSEVEEGVCKTLQAYVYDLDLKAEVTGGRKYSVVLIDGHDSSHAVLNKALVIRGLANWILNENSVIENVVSKYSDILKNTVNSEESSCDELLSTTELKSVAEPDTSVEMVKWNSRASERNFTKSSDIRWVDGKMVPYEEPMDDNGDIWLNFMEALADSSNYDQEELWDVLPVDKEEILHALRYQVQKKQSSVTIQELPEVEKVADTSDIDGDVSENEMNSDDDMKRNKRNVKSIPTQLRTKRKTVKCNFDDVDEDDDNDNPPPLLSCCKNDYTPNITWYQDLENVWLQIKLTAVKDYKLTWTFRTLSFRTNLEGKFYRVDLNFFGPMNTEKLEHSAKGFYVLVKMEKIARGHLWPRLLISKSRYPWLKMNLDHLGSSSDSGEDRKKKGNEKCGKNFDYKDLIIGPKPPGVYSDSEYSSDPYDPPDVEDDAENPFSNK